MSVCCSASLYSMWQTLSGKKGLSSLCQAGPSPPGPLKGGPGRLDRFSVSLVFSISFTSHCCALWESSSPSANFIKRHESYTSKLLSKHFIYTFGVKRATSTDNFVHSFFLFHVLFFFFVNLIGTNCLFSQLIIDEQ